MATVGLIPEAIHKYPQVSIQYYMGSVHLCNNMDQYVSVLNY